jgi:hypothetical protein
MPFSVHSHMLRHAYDGQDTRALQHYLSPERVPRLLEGLSSVTIATWRALHVTDCVTRHRRRYASRMQFNVTQRKRTLSLAHLVS